MIDAMLFDHHSSYDYEAFSLSTQATKTQNEAQGLNYSVIDYTALTI